jgi:hypothetical protein
MGAMLEANMRVEIWKRCVRLVPVARGTRSSPVPRLSARSPAHGCKRQRHLVITPPDDLLPKPGLSTLC